MLPSPCEHLF